MFSMVMRAKGSAARVHANCESSQSQVRLTETERMTRRRLELQASIIRFSKKSVKTTEILHLAGTES